MLVDWSNHVTYKMPTSRSGFFSITDADEKSLTSKIESFKNKKINIVIWKLE